MVRLFCTNVCAIQSVDCFLPHITSIPLIITRFYLNSFEVVRSPFLQFYVDYLAVKTFRDLRIVYNKQY